LTEKYPNGYYRVDHPMPPATRVKRSLTGHVRDPQRTQDRILAAALAEFSAEGFAGARVARIARRARVNKRMLYHYFGNKEDLFRGIFDRKLVQRAAWLTEAPPDLGASLAYWFQLACEDSDWIRLVQWEALGMADQPVIREAERRASFARALGDLRARQRRGLLPAPSSNRIPDQKRKQKHPTRRDDHEDPESGASERGHSVCNMSTSRANRNPSREKNCAERALGSRCHTWAEPAQRDAHFLLEA